MGRVFDFSGGGVEATMDEATQMEWQELYLNGRNELTQERSDGRVLRRAGNGVTLIQESDDTILKSWEQCDVDYMGQVYDIRAAFLDARGHTWLAALGQMPVVRVTDLETGVDLALFPTVGYPQEAQFSKDGQRLYVLTKGGENSEWKPRSALQIFDMSKRMADEKKSYTQHPLICIWPDE
jgi:hypothetical protein